MKNIYNFIIDSTTIFIVAMLMAVYGIIVDDYKYILMGIFIIVTENNKLLRKNIK